MKNLRVTSYFSGLFRVISGISHSQVSRVREFTWHSGTVVADPGCSLRNCLETCGGTGYGSINQTTFSERTSLPMKW